MRGSAPSKARQVREKVGTKRTHPVAKRRCSYRSMEGGEGVLTGRGKRATKEPRD